MAIKVAITGMGDRGRDWVREVRTSTEFELGACVEVDREVLDQAATDLNLPPQQCFVNLEEALEQTGCQAVIVVTPADCHVEACELALQRRLAVMVEKPFTQRLGEAIKLVALADQQGVPLLVAQNYRYLRSFSTVKRIMQDGRLGRVGQVMCHYFTPPHKMAASLARLPESVLWGMGVHHLDALRYVLGKEVTEVAADSFTQPGSELPKGASLRAMLSFENGTRVLYSATYESSGHEYFERGQEFYTRFVGDRATLHVLHRWLVICEKGKLPRLVRRGPRPITEEQILLRQLERAMIHGEPAEVSGRDNLQTMAIIEACVRSAANRTWVNPQVLLNDTE